MLAINRYQRASYLLYRTYPFFIQGSGFSTDGVPDVTMSTGSVVGCRWEVVAGSIQVSDDQTLLSFSATLKPLSTIEGDAIVEAEGLSPLIGIGNLTITVTNPDEPPVTQTVQPEDTEQVDYRLDLDAAEMDDGDVVDEPGCVLPDPDAFVALPAPVVRRRQRRCFRAGHQHVFRIRGEFFDVRPGLQVVLATGAADFTWGPTEILPGSTSLSLKVRSLLSYSGTLKHLTLGIGDLTITVTNPDGQTTGPVESLPADETDVNYEP